MSRKLRILALNWRCLRHPQAGGSETNLFAQARCWARQGHEVTVLCARHDSTVSREELIDGVRVLRRGGRFTVYPLVALFLLICSGSYDCIIDVSNGIPFFAPLFSSTRGVLLIHHVHGQQWYSEFPRPVALFGAWLETRLVPWVYRGWPIIAVSPTTRDALVQLGIAAERIHIVYNGITPPLELPATPRTGTRIAYVGRLKRYKRLSLLVRAVAALRSSIPDIRLDLAGDGDARAELEELIAKLDLGAHVTLHGFVDDATKARLLAEADVFATPSMHEGWGLSVIEANGYGCPAVAFDVPGLCIAIRHGETGLLAHNMAEFQANLAAILCDPTTRQQMAAAARRWAAHFDWESCAAGTLDVLHTTTVARQPLGTFQE